jgi:hypothetical protein
MTHTNTNEKAPGACNSKGLTTDTNGVNFRTLLLDRKDQAKQLKEITGWRGNFAAVNASFRKYGLYDALADGCKARRAMARMQANAAKKAGKA